MKVGAAARAHGVHLFQYFTRTGTLFFKAFEDENGKHFHESELPGHTYFEAYEGSWPTVFSSFTR